MLAMNLENPGLTPRIWQVGALCRAMADALDARFNPVAVRGEISGFSRASSGHCYFSIKDDTGQIRCAMFRRTASGLDFETRDGDLVEVRGRLAVYEARGDLQLIVESLQRAGQGALFEQFLRLKTRLEAEGLSLDIVADELGKDLDPFDLICHVAFDATPLPRRQRVDNVRRRDVFGKYGYQARAGLVALLAKYRV